jgi:hypothetical protein
MFTKKVNEAEKKAGVKAGTGKERLKLIVKTVAVPLLVAGVVVCALYLAIQSKAKAENLKGKALVMKKAVSQNTYITDKNIDQYFTEESIELSAIPGKALKTKAELPKEGFYIENDLGAKQMVMKDDIKKTDEVMDKYKAGHLVTSFAADSYDNSVNGSLRHGDIVDVYAMNPSTETLQLMASDIYVDSVYDNSGKEVKDDEGIAVSFTVWVTPEEVQQINTAVADGGVQMYLKSE